MKILLTSLLVMFAAIATAAQTSMNWKGYDTCQITNFKKDSMRVTRTFNFTNAENKMVAVIWDDTVHAARKDDSAHFEIGYQLGAPIISLLGVLDTIWSACIVIDTVNQLTASKEYDPMKYGGTAAWALTASTETNTRAHGQIDTTIGTSSSGVFIPIVPFWSPFVRFYLHGLGDNAGTFLRAKLIFEQRAYVNVRNQ